MIRRGPVKGPNVLYRLFPTLDEKVDVSPGCSRHLTEATWPDTDSERSLQIQFNESLPEGERTRKANLGGFTVQALLEISVFLH